MRNGGRPRAACRKNVARALEAKALDSPRVRVHEPTVGNAQGRVSLGLAAPIVLARRGGENLDDEEGNPFHSALRHLLSPVDDHACTTGP